jgi:hypothetical protein
MLDKNKILTYTFHQISREWSRQEIWHEKRQVVRMEETRNAHRIFVGGSKTCCDLDGVEGIVVNLISTLIEYI